MNKITVEELRENAIKRQRVIEALIGVFALCLLFGMAAAYYINFYL